ncbi:MAG: tRNA pseudouridine(38-40) synthase TruA [Lachnospiraceae bacterium]|nr:tRNA pseudouridine(38-40) synthase TruA [Lachnospiraceae bacterium]
MRIFLKIAYDGTNYHGFQCQNNANSVQDTVNAALSDLFKKEMKTIGASRTDTGVHAHGNVAVFDVDTRIEPSRIAFAVNARLPMDIRIVESRRVPDDFHPRYTTTIKTYSYHILNRTHPDPLFRNLETHCYYPLDEKAMNEAASFLVGEHDFLSFCAAGNSSATTIRTIYSAEVARTGDRLTFTITGNGFLYNMVRIIAGTLMEVGQGFYPPSHMREIIEARDRKAAGPTALAKGLVLERIEYPDLTSSDDKCMMTKN